MSEEKKYAFDDLRVHYGTFHAENVSKEPRRKVIRTWACMKTNMGKIEVSEWKKLIQAAIERADEQDLQQALIETVRANCAWLHKDSEIVLYALELHASRIFDNTEWVLYEEFNRKYRPGVWEEGK